MTWDELLKIPVGDKPAIGNVVRALIAEITSLRARVLALETPGNSGKPKP